jgi:hypothetical protein
MPDGACVIKYHGMRGDVWRIKYRDTTGRQVKETLGRTSDGWTKRKAEAELRARLTDVKRDGLRKPAVTTFETFAREWLDTYPEANSLKRSTVDGYTTIVEAHLIPALGPAKLDAIGVERLERYVADKRRQGLAPRTVNRHLKPAQLAVRVGVEAEAAARAGEPGPGRGSAAGAAAALAHPDAGGGGARGARVRRVDR